METDVAAAAPSAAAVVTPEDAPPPPPAKPLRLWLPIAFVALYWVGRFAFARMELPMVVRFGSILFPAALLTVAFTAWWAFSRRVPRREKWPALAALLAGAALAVLLTLHTFGVILALMIALPAVFTTWTLWLLVARRLPPRARVAGLCAAILLTFGAFTLLRAEGTSGEQNLHLAWRWSPSAEDLYLAERAKTANASQSPVPPLSRSPVLSLHPGDWPGFRGPHRDGAVTGLRIDADWSAHPPKQVWKRRVGPAWSSVAVVDGRLFTQEQRGEAEAVVCLDANTGNEIWSVLEPGRFWEGVSGAGPRATPTFADGRIYSLGARGTLNCLDAATGAKVWTRDIAADAGGAPVPMWGFSSSPLVSKGVVVVYAGGPGTKDLLAYRADTGAPAWSADAGTQCYTSPQPATINGQEQVLFFSDAGLIVLDPVTGAVRGQHPAPLPNSARAVQPRQVGPTQVLISSELDFGAALLDLTPGGDASSPWSANARWSSRQLKPSFNDFVVTNDAIYGFDGAIFACVDLNTGKRRWREGEFGHGQVVLLADQSLLLVMAEEGDVVLLAADPKAHRELARFHALDGKTWNHPAVAQGRLYVRNGEQMACYELPVVGAR